MSTPREYILTFSGAGVQPVQAVGRHLRITEAPSAPVFVALSDGSEIKRAAGQGVNIAEGFGMGRISIRSTVAQTVRVLVAGEEQPDNAANVSVSVTASIGAAQIIDNGGDVSIAGTSADNVVSGDPDTLAVTVTSLETNDPSAPLRVGTAGVGATSGHPLWPGDSHTMTTTATVRVYNPHGVAQNVAVVRLAR